MDEPDCIEYSWTSFNGCVLVLEQLDEEAERTGEAVGVCLLTIAPTTEPTTPSPTKSPTEQPTPSPTTPEEFTFSPTPSPTVPPKGTTTSPANAGEETTAIIFDADYPSIIGSRSALFLRECTEEVSKDFDQVECISVSPGSIIVVIGGPSDSRSSVAEDLRSNGLHLPSFEHIHVAVENSRANARTAESDELTLDDLKNFDFDDVDNTTLFIMAGCSALLLIAFCACLCILCRNLCSRKERSVQRKGNKLKDQYSFDIQTSGETPNPVLLDASIDIDNEEDFTKLTTAGMEDVWTTSERELPETEAATAGWFNWGAEGEGITTGGAAYSAEDDSADDFYRDDVQPGSTTKRKPETRRG